MYQKFGDMFCYFALLLFCLWMKQYSHPSSWPGGKMDGHTYMIFEILVEEKNE